jgi:hypothetical protein
MPWVVLFHDAFEPEFAGLDEAMQNALLIETGLLERFGPTLGRPHVDTLKGSKHRNMKELRIRTPTGAWRFAFAFDPRRQAVILVGGDKSGVARDRFYRPLIKRADERFDRWLARET